MNKPLLVTFAAVFSGVIIIGSVLLLVVVNSKTTSTVSCSKKGKTHQVAIQNGVVKPATTNAKLCDTIVIKNTDSETRKIGFGDHDKHVAFSGVEEKLLKKGESFSLLVTQTGTAYFHDHYDYDAEGTLIVTN